MSLLDLVESDNAFLLEDAVMGFSRPITFTEEDGVTVHQVVGQVNRISVEVDPGTGIQIPANKASVTARIGATTTVDGVPVVTGLGGVIPRPLWTISTTDVTGAALNGKIPKTGDNVFPDRTLGRVTIIFKVVE